MTTISCFSRVTIFGHIQNFPLDAGLSRFGGQIVQNLSNLVVPRLRVHCILSDISDLYFTFLRSDLDLYSGTLDPGYFAMT